MSSIGRRQPEARTSVILYKRYRRKFKAKDNKLWTIKIYTEVGYGPMGGYG